MSSIGKLARSGTGDKKYLVTTPHFKKPPSNDVPLRKLPGNYVPSKKYLVLSSSPPSASDDHCDISLDYRVSEFHLMKDLEAIKMKAPRTACAFVFGSISPSQALVLHKTEKF